MASSWYELSHRQIAGQNAERLAALSDGIFAVAMTLRLLELRKTQLNHLARSDRELACIHLAFLFAVTLMPFSEKK